MLRETVSSQARGWRGTDALDLHGDSSASRSRTGFNESQILGPGEAMPLSEGIPKGVYLDHAQLTLGQVRQLYLLDSNSLTGAPIERFVDGAERSLAYAFSEALQGQTSQLLALLPNVRTSIKRPGASSYRPNDSRSPSDPGLAELDSPARGSCPSAACRVASRIWRQPRRPCRSRGGDARPLTRPEAP